jgi:hypothetical protein
MFPDYNGVFNPPAFGSTLTATQIATELATARPFTRRLYIRMRYTIETDVAATIIDTALGTSVAARWFTVGASQVANIVTLGVNQAMVPTNMLAFIAALQAEITGSGANGFTFVCGTNLNMSYNGTYFSRTAGATVLTINNALQSTQPYWREIYLQFRVLAAEDERFTIRDDRTGVVYGGRWFANTAGAPYAKSVQQLIMVPPGCRLVPTSTVNWGTLITRANSPPPDGYGLSSLMGCM